MAQLGTRLYETSMKLDEISSTTTTIRCAIHKKPQSKAIVPSGHHCGHNPHPFTNRHTPQFHPKLCVSEPRPKADVQVYVLIGFLFSKT